ncbi:hypothetical protein DM806_17975 [Sphingobium lactosutens]|nr:hypothetical protein [Sphingobium lactosutens]
MRRLGVGIGHHPVEGISFPNAETPPTMGAFDLLSDDGGALPVVMQMKARDEDVDNGLGRCCARPA